MSLLDQHKPNSTHWARGSIHMLSMVILNEDGLVDQLKRRGHTVEVISNFSSDNLVTSVRIEVRSHESNVILGSIERGARESINQPLRELCLQVRGQLQLLL